MAAEYELVRHGKMHRLNIFVNRIVYRSNHMHSDFEIVIVLDGEGHISTRRHEYRLAPGSIVFLNSNEPHDITGYDFGVTLLLVQFSRNFLQDYYPLLADTIFLDGDLSRFMPEDDLVAVRNTLLDAAVEYLSGKTYFELTCLSQMAAVLHRFFTFLPKELISSSEAVKRTRNEQRMSRISAYLEENFQMPVRLSDLAEQEGVSATHLSHFIAEHFGMTFQDYLNHIRFEHAVRIIGNPSLTLTEVSAESGFSELKYMTRMFEKQLGVKPARFREHFIFLENESTGDTSPETKTLEYLLPDEEGLQEVRKARRTDQ